jgi:hypothetical protein
LKEERNQIYNFVKIVVKNVLSAILQVGVKFACSFLIERSNIAKRKYVIESYFAVNSNKV